MGILPRYYADLRKMSEIYGLQPRFHGNGFVQLYLSKAERLHVFHPDLLPTRVENARIHDHRWGMHSRVLLGLVEHITYDAVPHIEGTFSIKEVQGTSNKEVPLVEVPGSRCRLKKTGYNIFAAGSEYFFPCRQFHESGAPDLAMTFIVKSNDDGKPARVISPYGEVPDHAFETQPPLDDIWQAIEDAYKAYKGS